MVSNQIKSILPWLCRSCSSGVSTVKWSDEAANSSLQICKRDDEKLELIAWITAEENGTSKNCIERTHEHMHNVKKKTNINTYVAIVTEKNVWTATMSKFNEFKSPLSNYYDTNVSVTTIQRYNYDSVYML
jgi:hypothetical protein